MLSRILTAPVPAFPHVSPPRPTGAALYKSPLCHLPRRKTAQLHMPWHDELVAKNAGGRLHSV